jgi:hypothetical protein
MTKLRGSNLESVSNLILGPGVAPQGNVWNGLEVWNGDGKYWATHGNGLSAQVINVFLSPQIPLKDVFLLKKKKAFKLTSCQSPHQLYSFSQADARRRQVMLHPAGHFVVSTNVI